MRRQVRRLAATADVVIAAAAVCDWRFLRPSKHKKSRGPGSVTLTLVPNVDIIGELGRNRRGARPILVGFALETRDILRRAASKLQKKGLDLIVANGAQALGRDSSRALIVDRSGIRLRIGPVKKALIARSIFKEIKAIS
jgi:phosphopantothenoylcysteine decarboxylase/phosphopantothenate--cysteine ligase